MADNNIATPKARRKGRARKDIFMLCGGIRHGRLTVVGEAPDKYAGTNHEVRMALCKCDCGKIVEKIAIRIKKGMEPSCGCSQSSIMSIVNTKHGQSERKDFKSPEYRAWTSMNARCYRKTIKCFKDYGGRGIIVCDEWRYSYENFINFMGKRPTSKHSLDRIDWNGNYEPSNCKWSTKKEQAQNKRGVDWIRFEWGGMPVIEISRQYGVSEPWVRRKVREGKMTGEQIIAEIVEGLASLGKT